MIGWSKADGIVEFCVVAAVCHRLFTKLTAVSKPKSKSCGTLTAKRKNHAAFDRVVAKTIRARRKLDKGISAKRRHPAVIAP